MITEENFITCSEQYLLSRGIAPESCAFFDIETTGFRASASHLYLIGAAHRISEPDGTGTSQWRILQWLAERPQEETALLHAFSAFLHSYHTLLHFNGNRFDIPYLAEKYDQYQIPSPFETLRSIDLYQEFRPLKAFLKLERMNQKSLELFLGLRRDDTYDGGRLIPVYHEFCKTGSEEKRRLLLLHNAEDASGMFTLLSLYGYLDFLQNSAERKQSVRLLMNQNGNRQLLFSFPLRLPVPVPVSVSSELGYLTLQNQTGRLLVQASEGTFYYYFQDYKNYYYLPAEDQAIHKNVAAYVDKEYRQSAKAENCYIKQYGTFLPQPQELFTPAFRRNFRDPLSWFLWEDDMLQDDTKLAAYLNILLRKICGE